MRQLNYFLLLAIFAFLTNSCRNNPEEEKKQIGCTADTWEVFAGDTLNVSDCHGKQGIWIPRHDNNLKDTAFFKDSKIESRPENWSKSNNYVMIIKSWPKRITARTHDTNFHSSFEFPRKM